MLNKKLKKPFLVKPVCCHFPTLLTPLQKRDIIVSEKLQVGKLADRLSDMSKSEIAQIAGSNPDLFAEWIAELTRHHNEARSEAARMNTALTRLRSAISYAAALAA